MCVSNYCRGVLGVVFVLGVRVSYNLTGVLSVSNNCRGVLGVSVSNNCKGVLGV